jgi:uncharacterized protein YecA (UPF0149 family)
MMFEHKTAKDLEKELKKMSEPSKNKKMATNTANVALFYEACKKAEEAIANDKYGTVHGHVVGSDNGVDQDRLVGTKGEKFGRNDQCPCNSGKKVKKCCKTLSGFRAKQEASTDDE